MRISLAVVLACAAGCTTTSTAPGGAFPTATTSVQLSLLGGLAPQAGPGSTCQPIDEHYTYELSTRHLTWTICSSPTVGGVYTPVPGSATLSADDATNLVNALRAVEPATTECGGDITEMFDFATPGGTKHYAQAGCMPGASDVIDLITAAAQ
jgi:hypothetical protein